eukprot:398562-Pyramimonas_sp.AAC.1
MTPHGEEMQAKDSVVYLGATINSTGHIHAELNKRLGRAWREFRKYTKVWTHTSISFKRNFQIHQAMITQQNHGSHMSGM